MARDRRYLGYQPYRTAQLATRDAVGTISNRSLAAIDRALSQYADDLTRMLARLSVGPTDEAKRRAIQQVQTYLHDTLQPELQRLLAEGVSASRDAAFADVLDLQTKATLAVASAHGVPDAALAAVLTPNVSLAGAWETAGISVWRTVLPQYAGAAIADVRQIVTHGLLAGLSPDQLAKRLRPYVQGSEPFQQAFRGAGEITDAMLRDPRFTQEARKLRHNSERIAFSETQLARAEAETQAFAADPMVGAVAWRLSPFRGTQTTPDVCDLLATIDWYGLGPGIYPVSAVPAIPHPWDRCERVPILRPMAQVGQPKPKGTLKP